MHYLPILAAPLQVESFALLLLQLTLPALAAGTQLHVVEFGSGSGNLVLPLAHLFPCFTFTAVDMKASAVQLLQQRVQQGGIGNVAVREGTIEMYDGEHCQQGSQDVGLHAHMRPGSRPICRQSCQRSTPCVLERHGAQSVAAWLQSFHGTAPSPHSCSSWTIAWSATVMLSRLSGLLSTGCVVIQAAVE